MIDIVGIRDVFSIDVHHRSQSNITELALHKLLFLHLQFYISKKTERFSYKDTCGVRGHCTCSSLFKGRAFLSYR